MEYTFSRKISNIKSSAIREILKAPVGKDSIVFAAGNPSPETFPVEELAKLSAEIYRDNPIGALQYGVTDGYTPLREVIAERQYRKYGIGKSVSRGDSFNDTTIIVTGGQQGIDLSCRVLCNEGDAVICENPTFIGALNAFRSNYAQTIGVPVEDDGIDTDALEKTITERKNAKLIYLIPTFQNPSGITMSLEKRKKVYDIALRHKLMILEDNPYEELRFSGERIPTIKSLDTEGIVIYCSSFSKILSAGMRVGFVIAPEPVCAKMVIAKQTIDVHTNLLSQMICHKYMTECDLEVHISRNQGIYRHKCTLMLDSLEKYMPESVKFTRPEGGLFIWCTLPDSIDCTQFVRAASAKDVRVVPGATFNCDTDAPSNSFRLNYSTPTDEQIEKGIKILGDLAKEMEQER